MKNREGYLRPIEEPNNINHNSTTATCCGVMGIVCVYACIATVGLTFLIMDRIQSGKIYYFYHNNYSRHYTYVNKIECGHASIRVHCSHTFGSDQYHHDIFYVLNTTKFDRYKVNEVYKDAQDEATIYIICTYIGCLCPYVILPFLWLLKPDRDAKQCHIATKHKCVTLFLLSMVASIVAVVFGVKLSNEQNCSDGLQQYIELQIGISDWNESYEWTQDPHTEYGATLIFMMVNCGITLIFTLLSANCVLRPSKKRNAKIRAYSHFIEGVEEAISSKRYGSAKLAKYSVNLYSEGV